MTGGLDFVARAEKVFGPLPPATAPWRVKRAALAAPRASLGVAYDSRRDAVTARAAVAAAADLGGEAWLEARAAVELDPRPGGVAAPAARVTLAKNVFDFAPAQQVRRPERDDELLEVPSGDAGPDGDVVQADRSLLVGEPGDLQHQPDAVSTASRESHA